MAASRVMTWIRHRLVWVVQRPCEHRISPDKFRHIADAVDGKEQFDLIMLNREESGKEKPDGVEDVVREAN
jgi:hypothetical protein